MANEVHSGDIPLADQGHSHCSEPYISGLLPENVEKQMAETILSIHQMHDAGTPLYTKRTLHAVSLQLEKALIEKRGKIWMRGMDGRLVDFDVEIGYTYPADYWEPGLEYVLFAYIEQVSNCDQFV